MERLALKYERTWRDIKLEEGLRLEASLYSNYVITGKFTLLNFLPKNFAEQFMRLSTLWFILVAAVDTNPFGLDYAPSYISLILLFIHLVLSISKDSLSAYRRYRGDVKINEELFKVWTGQSFTWRRCKDLLVGDCLLLPEASRVPADMVLLASNTDSGVCYLSTSSIIGESNLVTKISVRETNNILYDYEDPPIFNFHRLNAVFKYEQPNSNFNSFSGSLKLQYVPRAIPLRLDNFLLRGSTIHGAEWVVAIIVYAGMETKIWINKTSTNKKPASFIKILNGWTLVAGFTVLIISAVQILIQSQRSQEHPTGSDYLQFLTIYNDLVPISLYIALDIVRIAHIIKLQNEKSKQFTVTVNSGELTEDLGKVNYVLADKTGTLTENELELVAVVIGSRMFTSLPPDPAILYTRPRATNGSFLRSDSALDPPIPTVEMDYREGNTFLDLQKEMQSATDELFQCFAECVTLCNSVVPIRGGKYLATSIDEEALVHASEDMGCKLICRSLDECDVDFFDTCFTYQVVSIRKFSSELRRMRILVQREVDDFATLYIKGAYAVLKDMMRMEPEERVRLEEQLETLTKKGLRTMIMCYRRISGDYLSEVKQKILNVKLSKVNVEGKLEVLFLELEKEMRFLAITGIRDKILPETKECLDMLQRAGLETWIVSGDSESNTLACAYSLGLMSPMTEIVSLRGINSKEQCLRKLLQVVNESIFHNSPVEAIPEHSPILHLSSFLRRRFIPESVDFTVSIDNVTLETALKESDSRRLLICVLFASTMACFNCMHPNNKRQVVKLLREGLSTSPVVLAVGDGSNDVPMLMEADIGIGIRGRQGEKAAQSSDISINSFSSLAELILKNGKRNSILVGQTVLLFLYSQVLMVLMSLTLTFFADCTASSPETEELRILISLVFTSVPIVFVGILNNRLTDQACFKYPNTYNKTSYASLSWSSIRRYATLAILHYVFIAGLTFSSFFSQSASVVSSEELTIVVAIACTLSINQQCCYEVKKVTLGLVLAEIVGFGVLILYIAVDFDSRAALEHVFTSPQFLLGMFGSPLACTVISQIFGYYNSRKDSIMFNPNLFRVAPDVLKNSFTQRVKAVSGALLRVYRQRGHFKAKTEHANYELNYRNAKFKSVHTEKGFELDFINTKLTLLRVLLVLVIAELIIPIVNYNINEDSEIERVMSILGCAAVTVLFISFWMRSYALTVSTLFALGFIIATALIDLVAENTVDCHVYFFVTTGLMLFVREYWLRNFLVATISTVLLLFVVSLNTGVHQAMEICDAAGTLIVQVLVTLVAGYASYLSALRERQEFALIKDSEEKITQSDSILRCLLPDFVQKRVRDGIRYIAEDQGSVTVIFIEICDFDQICARYSPGELIALLDDIFRKIDGICESIRVAKIETVGKVYMACAGFRDFEIEVAGETTHIPHARRALELAFAVLSTFRTYQLLTDKLLQFKIGIHTGSVIAGVVGFHKPQFSLVGDTVNTASRVCTTVDTPNTVQISDATSAALDTVSIYEMVRKIVQAKGKGDLGIYSVRENSVSHADRSRRRTADNSLDLSSPIPKPGGLMRHGSLARSGLRNSIDLGNVYSKSDKELVEKVSLFHCSTHELENHFRLERMSRDISLIGTGMVTFVLGLTVLFIWRVVSYSSNQTTSNLVPPVLYLLLLVCVSVYRIFLRLLHPQRIFPWFLLITYSCAATIITIDGLVLETFGNGLTSLILGFLLILVYYCSGAFFRHAVFATAVILIPWAAIALSTYQVALVIFFLLYAVQHCLCIYQQERDQRAFFNLSKLAKREIEKTERLVTQMMPLHAYESLKREQWSTDRLTDVTLLYADISGFTAWSSCHTPQEVIDKLSKIFTAFDGVCVAKGVYKVHTIGDCYVAMGATGNSDQRDVGDECVRMVSFALEMVKVVQHVCEEDDDNLNMRIGLHVGEVTAGITGTHIVRYDIYGQDVLVANKMESSGKEGRVNVSAQLKALLETAAPNKYNFDLNKTLEIREVGRSVECYFVSETAKDT